LFFLFFAILWLFLYVCRVLLNIHDNIKYTKTWFGTWHIDGQNSWMRRQTHTPCLPVWCERLRSYQKYLIIL
jgi:hypothetical protein